jgi:hypothetical protein
MASPVLRIGHVRVMIFCRIALAVPVALGDQIANYLPTSGAPAWPSRS